ncbi:hypothetical protein [Saccharopolyspora griseoalba]|uniref:Uncharacterized protein n=1 Tax=Saccharopolyspora griseoalba TaxID=1431848 RepID=A0ABW2LMR3_9PSEU
MGPRGKPNPLFKPRALRRSAAAGFAGLALALLGAPSAHAAEPLVVGTSLAVVEAEPGQQVVVAPETMDLKLREAVLLAMPLAFGPADDAVEQFDQQSPIPLGTAEVGTTTYSGSQIADAAAPRLEQIGLPADKLDAVRFHFDNLVGLANSVTVKVPEPEPSEPPSEEQPPPPQESAPPRESTEPSPAPAAAPPPPPSAQSSAPPLAPSAGSAPRALSVLPPSLRSASELPWANAGYGRIPGSAPSVGDLAARAEQKQREQARQEEIRAAGSAEAMPGEASEKVALPVLLAAISLAVVTAALVRSWVLRKQ